MWFELGNAANSPALVCYVLCAVGKKQIIKWGNVVALLSDVLSTITGIVFFLHQRSKYGCSSHTAHSRSSVLPFGFE